MFPSDRTTYRSNLPRHTSVHSRSKAPHRPPRIHHPSQLFHTPQESPFGGRSRQPCGSTASHPFRRRAKMARLLLLGSRPRRPRHRSTPLLLLLILLGLVAATTTALGAQAAAEPSMVPAINGTMLVFPTGEGAVVVAEADRSASVCASNRVGSTDSLHYNTYVHTRPSRRGW